MKKLFVLLLLSCGGLSGPIEEPIDTVKVLTSPDSYCGLIEMRKCGNFCIPIEDSTCCIRKNRDGGTVPESYWYGVSDAGCY